MNTPFFGTEIQHFPNKFYFKKKIEISETPPLDLWMMRMETLFRPFMDAHDRGISHAKLECDRKPRKESDSYLFRVRKMDMEMTPDTLETGGVNDLFVVVAANASFTTEQSGSGSSGTHRVRS